MAVVGWLLAIVGLTGVLHRFLGPYLEAPDARAETKQQGLSGHPALSRGEPGPLGFGGGEGGGGG